MKNILHRRREDEKRMGIPKKQREAKKPNRRPCKKSLTPSLPQSPCTDSDISGTNPVGLMEQGMDIQERSGVHVLHPEGELTIFEAAEFREALLTLEKHEDPIELDMSDVERVDSSGIQLVVAALQGKRVSVRGVTPQVVEKFASIGCAQIIKDSEQ